MVKVDDIRLPWPTKNQHFPEMGFGGQGEIVWVLACA
jgi:hypothetical protein